MNKKIKKISIVFIILTLLCTIIGSFVYAQPALPDTGLYEPDPGSAPDKVTTIIGTIANIVQVVGIVFAVAVLIMLGIKYMVGSAEARADYKKTMIPYLIGATFLFATGTIVKLISQLTNSVIQ